MRRFADLYGVKKPFASEPARLEYLFERYQALVDKA